MVRVVLRELETPCEEVELVDFPPPPSFFDLNPLGQVPVLETPRGALFPTRMILDALVTDAPSKFGGMVANVRRDPSNWQDEQMLAVILLMGDAIVAVKYQDWSGLRPMAENLVGYDLAERHSVRIQHTLDWLEGRWGPAGYRNEGLSVQDIALSCLLLWTEARGGFPWRGRPRLEATVSRCESRSSFAATKPQPWP